jgi:hypothetical protein
MMVFTICGDLGREGVFELPLGSPLRYLVEELAGGPPAGRAIKAIFPGASNTVIVLQQPRRAAGLRLGAAGGFGPGRGRVRGVRRLGLHGAGGLPVLAIPVRGVMRAVPGLQVRDRRGHPDPASAGGGRRIGSGSGAHPGPGKRVHRRAEVRPADRGEPAPAEPGPGFQAEFASHIGRSCPLPRELPFHKLVDWDAAAGRFAYDLAMHKQPDWTYSSWRDLPQRRVSAQRAQLMA